MIVIKTDHELEIGKVYGNNPWEHMTDYNGEDGQSPAFRVVAEATVEDYYASIQIEAGIAREQVSPQWVDAKRFYFVQMD